VSASSVVCDTTILLYLGRISWLDLLPALFSPIYVPEQVVAELDMGRLLRRDTTNPRQLDWASVVSVEQSVIDRLPPNRLGVGEQSVIAYAQAHGCKVVGLDELQARELAEQLGLKAVGILGIFLLAKRQSLIPAVRPLMDAVVDQGFRLGVGLYEEVLELAGEKIDRG
jgi:predicted nucleic acid-binding protein